VNATVERTVGVSLPPDLFAGEISTKKQPTERTMSKSDHELRVKVHSAMYFLIKDKGAASPVEVLISVGALSKADYERWRNGQIDYLERACKFNLRLLSLVNREIRVYARKHDLKPSWTAYNRWGKGSRTRLRFSKSGDENIEKLYATHYVSRVKVEEAKAKRDKKKESVLTATQDE